MSIQNEITRIAEAKEAIRQSIVSKGVELSEGESIDNYAAAISAIEGIAAVQYDKICITDTSGSATQTLTLNLDKMTMKDAAYSFDDVNWVELPCDEFGFTTEKTSKSIEYSEKIFLRWSGISNSDSQTKRIDSGGSFTVSGDLYGYSAYQYYSLFYHSSVTDASGLKIHTSFVGNYCFQNIFRNCSALTTPPDFSNVTSVGDNGFYEAFSHCTVLTAPPDFSNVTSVGAYGFQSAFDSCSALTTPPDFSNVTSVGNYGFSKTFYNCSALTTPPDFSSVTSIVDNSGFSSTFHNCTALTEAPDFSNVTSVGYYSFRSTFSGCTSLTTAPDFSSVTTVGQNGFASTFSGCTSLTTAPDFSSVTTVSQNGFQGTFENCTALTTVYAPEINTWNTSTFNNWLSGVASEGTLYYNGLVHIPTDNVSGCPTGWSLTSTREEATDGYFYVEDLSGVDNTLSIKKNNSSAPTVKVLTSTDQTNWTELGDTSTTELTATIPANGRLYLKSTAGGWSDSNYYNTITASGNYAVGGNIMSLLYKGYYGYYDRINSYTFRYLFHNSTTLVDASRLVITATTVGSYGFEYAFQSCTALTTAPDFSSVATVGDGGFRNTFYGCRALTTPPDFSNVTSVGVYAFQSAFQNCTALTTAYAPDIDIWYTYNFSGWLSGVASEGTLYYNGTTDIPTGASGCPTGWDLIINEEASDGYFYVEDLTGADNTFSVKKLSDDSPTVTLYSSTDQTNWTELGSTSTTELTATIPANGRLYLKSLTPAWGTQRYGNPITASGNYAVGGNVMSLIYGGYYKSYNSITTEYALERLFCDSTTIIDASKLVIETEVGDSVLAAMFERCTNLTKAPDLSKLTISSGSENALGYMFAECSSLTTQPDFSGLTSVGNSSFYYAFKNCTSLTTPPDFSNVTTVAHSGFRNIFDGCTALTTAPDFSNVTSVATQGFQEAFRGCTALTTAPDFSNVTSFGYSVFASAFRGCTALTTVYAPDIDTWDTSIFNSWLANVASEGMLYYNGTTDIPTDSASGCPAGWSLEVYPA